MKHLRFGTLGFLLAAAALGGPATAAQAAPVTVNLRVEGSAGTVYEGPVTTDGKMITTQAGGTHVCDGTQGGNPTGASPGGAPTTALDDAAIAHGFTWDGRYGVGGFDDFLVERVGTDGTVGTFGSSSWTLFVDRVASSVGGCQTRVTNGDTVLWEWAGFNEPNLELSGPANAQVGDPVQVTVQQYDTSGNLTPADGATVGGVTTDSAGHATLSFSTPGTQRLKATQPGSIRSNAIDVCVFSPGSGACGSQPGGGAIKDKLPPEAAIRGIRNGQKFRRHHGPRKLAGSARDAGGLFQVYFRLRRHSHSGCQWYSSKRSVFTRPRRHCTARYQRVGSKSHWSYLLPKRLPKGKYTLEEKAVDRAFNRSITRVNFTVR